MNMRNAEVLVQSAVSQERENRFTTISVYVDWLDSNFKKRKGRLEEGSTSRLHIFYNMDIGFPHPSEELAQSCFH